MPIDDQSIHKSIARLRRKGIPFERGLSDKEVSTIEERFAFVFPPELRLLLQTALPASDYFPNWRTDSNDRLQEWLDQPVQGILFDVRNNVFWHDNWGRRPALLSDAIEVAAHYLRGVPKLIPIGDRTYLKCVPALPNSSGNPVFSIHQTDALHAGKDVPDFLTWFSRSDAAFDEDEETSDPPTPLCADYYQHVPFWTDLVRLNNDGWHIPND